MDPLGGMYSAPIKPSRLSSRSQGKYRNSKKARSSSGVSPQSSVLSVPNKMTERAWTQRVWRAWVQCLMMNKSWHSLSSLRIKLQLLGTWTGVGKVSPLTFVSSNSSYINLQMKTERSSYLLFCQTGAFSLLNIVVNPDLNHSYNFYMYMLQTCAV